MYSFIILLMIFCCTSFKSNNGPKNNNDFKKSKVVFDERYSSGIENFVFLVKEMIPKENCKEISKLIPCNSDQLMHSSASGFVFNQSKNAIFVMTAAHFCKNNDIPGFNENIVGFANEKHRNLFVIDLDEEKDICILLGTRLVDETFKKIKIAKKLPKIGEDVYTVAAPNGVGGPGFRLVFDGKFGGCTNEVCMTTMPATFGSSGAGIFNKHGELITIIMAVTEGFENLILSPSHKDIREFVDKVDRVVDIYP